MTPIEERLYDALESLLTKDGVDGINRVISCFAEKINDQIYTLPMKVETNKNNLDTDPVLPNYYQKAGNASPVHLIKQYNLNFPIGNVIKYAARYKDKNGVEDLKKALFYLLWELGLTIDEISEITKKVR